jgi:hypothetical protein
VSKGSTFPKMQLAHLLECAEKPNFLYPNDPHGVLANDDFMFRALESRGKKPVRDFCRWNHSLRVMEEKSPFEYPGFTPTKERPVVYHLFGHAELPQSMVLTENDYVDFLIAVSRHPGIFPPIITSYLDDTLLLFMGYDLFDSNFHMLFRYLKKIFIARKTLILLNTLSPEKIKGQNYIVDYFTQYDNIYVYFGNTEIKEKVNNPMREYLEKKLVK